jgi:hypothetical protein
MLKQAALFVCICAGFGAGVIFFAAKQSQATVVEAPKWDFEAERAQEAKEAQARKAEAQRRAAELQKRKSAIDADLGYGRSMAAVSAILGEQPFRTTVVAKGDVVDDFGIIAREKLVVARWELRGPIRVEAVFSHKKDQVVEKRVQ